MMAAADPFILSSPSLHRKPSTTPPSICKHTISSSPSLPPLSELLVGRSIHHAREITNTATPKANLMGFRSPRNFLQEVHGNGTPVPTSLEATHAPRTKDKPKDASSRRSDSSGRVKKVCPDTSGKERTVRPCKSPTLKVSPHFPFAEPVAQTKGSAAGETRSSKKPRKSDQSRIQSSKITKPHVSTSAEKRSKLRNTKKPSAQNGTENGGRAEEEQAKDPFVAQNEDGLGLREAVKRRKDWTPVKNTSARKAPLEEVEAAWSTLIPCQPPSLLAFSESGIGKILEDFEYADAYQATSVASLASRTTIGEAATKKRRLDVSYPNLYHL